MAKFKSEFAYFVCVSDERQYDLNLLLLLLLLLKQKAPAERESNLAS